MPKKACYPRSPRSTGAGGGGGGGGGGGQVAVASIEYTSVGAAVVASRGTVYDECCADGCGILAGGINEWFSALELLVNDDEKRVTMIKRAQEKLDSEYSIGRLRDQVLDVIGRAHAAAGERLAHEKKAEILVD